MYIYMYTQTHMCICIHMYVYLYMYIYVYTVQQETLWTFSFDVVWSSLLFFDLFRTVVEDVVLVFLGRFTCKPQCRIFVFNLLRLLVNLQMETPETKTSNIFPMCSMLRGLWVCALSIIVCFKFCGSGGHTSNKIKLIVSIYTGTCIHTYIYICTYIYILFSNAYMYEYSYRIYV